MKKIIITGVGFGAAMIRQIHELAVEQSLDILIVDDPPRQTIEDEAMKLFDNFELQQFTMPDLSQIKRKGGKRRTKKEWD